MGTGQPLPILYRQRGCTAWITLNRPNVLNALNSESVETLARHIERARENDEVRVLIISGEGRCFSTGGDLKAGLALRQQFGPLAPLERFLTPMRAVLRQLRELPKPVIGAVHGYCLAGGLELALCCDIVLAAEDAVFGDPRAAKGLIPALGGVVGLTRAVGMYKAREMLLTARTYSAQEMLAAGLVSSVISSNVLLDEADRMAQELGVHPAGAIARIKRMINHEATMDWEDATDYELSVNREHLLDGSDVTQGLEAFKNRRQ